MLLWEKKYFKLINTVHLNANTNVWHKDLTSPIPRRDSPQQPGLRGSGGVGNAMSGLPSDE